MRALIAFLFALSLWPVAAQADELRPGYLELTEQNVGQWQLVWKLPVTAVPSEKPPPPIIPKNCRFADAPDIGAAAGAIIGSAELKCDGDLAGRLLEMPGLIGQSDMLVRIHPLNAEPQALRLTSREPSAMIADEPGTWQVFKTYLVLGVEHILAGWDHLLFVIALVLLVKGWQMVVAAATAFTVAHSITLGGAALGLVGLPQKPVEALIALSIVFLALEIINQQAGKVSLTQRFPWVVAFLFGLLHGFGFASALTSIGLPTNDLAAALLAFNLGVETGQLLVIAGVIALLILVRRFAVKAIQPAVRFTAYSIGITGSYWLVDRTIV